MPGTSYTSSSQPRVLNLNTDLFGRRRFAAHFMPMRALNELYRRAGNPEHQGFCARLLSEMQIHCQVSDADLQKIPKTGPVVMVANHPFGLLDGLILAAHIPQIRPDVKIITNHLISEVPELDEICLFVDPFRRSVSRNWKPVKHALNWLRGGGLVAIFPSGEVSHWNSGHRRIEDPTWHDTATRLVQASGAKVVPAFFSGRNSVAFHTLGLIHPMLRTAQLGHEFLKARGRTVDLRIGSPIPAARIQNLSCARATDYLRWRTYLLANRHAPHPAQPRQLFPLSVHKAHKPLVAPVPADALASEVAALPEARRLAEDREFSAYVAGADEIPNVLHELGRLRELTFRAVGEGTGKVIDLDRFDRTYQHLFIWHKTKREIAGAYRIGCIDKLMSGAGPSALYTNTLFQFDPRLFEHFGDALELGRSFVRPEYQRQYAPLLLLWKAIGQFVCAQPRHAVLFGPVSISSDYSQVSRELLVDFYDSHLRTPLAEYVTPRHPHRRRMLSDWELKQYARALDTTDSLAEVIGDLENDGREIPILLKQYVKLGGQMLGFNVDREFSNVVDGLIMVDLRKTDHRVLERYLGKTGAHSFLQWHGMDRETPALAVAAAV